METLEDIKNKENLLNAEQQKLQEKLRARKEALQKKKDEQQALLEDAKKLEEELGIVSKTEPDPELTLEPTKMTVEDADKFLAEYLAEYKNTEEGKKPLASFGWPDGAAQKLKEECGALGLPVLSIEITENKQVLVDITNRKNEYVKGNLEHMKRHFDKSFFEKTKITLEQLKPSFKDFFNQVMSEQPDYIILLDKGARPFGLPFDKYLKHLNLNKKPEILFFNDTTYAGFATPEEAQEALKKDFIDSHPEKDFVNKKLFIVDETIQRGRGADRLLRFFDNNKIDGHYFAFSTEDNDYEYDYTKDKRLTIYTNPAEASFFTKVISESHVADYKDPDTGTTETKRRFEYVDESEVDKSKPLYQPELEKMKEIGNQTRKKVSDMIYETLMEIDLSPEAPSFKTIPPTSALVHVPKSEPDNIFNDEIDTSMSSHEAPEIPEEIAPAYSGLVKDEEALMRIPSYEDNLKSPFFLSLEVQKLSDKEKIRVQKMNPEEQRLYLLRRQKKVLGKMETGPERKEIVRLLKTFLPKQWSREEIERNQALLNEISYEIAKKRLDPLALDQITNIRDGIRLDIERLKKTPGSSESEMQKLLEQHDIYQRLYDATRKAAQAHRVEWGKTEKRQERRRIIKNGEPLSQEEFEEKIDKYERAFILHEAGLLKWSTKTYDYLLKQVENLKKSETETIMDERLEEIVVYKLLKEKSI